MSSSSSQHFTNLVDVNNPPLVDRTTLMCLHVSFLTIILNFLNTSNILDFFIKKYTHDFLEKISRTK